MRFIAAIVLGTLVFGGIGVAPALADASAASVSGTTFDQSGAPIYATVSLFSGTSVDSLVAETSSASDGTYTIANVPAGSYIVQFERNPWSDAYETQYYPNLNVIDRSTPSIQRLTVSGAVTGIDAHLTPRTTQTVSGRVTTTDTGAPRVGEIVQVRGLAFGSENAPGGDATTTTGADGSYSFPVPYGSYMVSFREPDGAGSEHYTGVNYNNQNYVNPAASFVDPFWGPVSRVEVTDHAVGSIDAQLTRRDNVTAPVYIAGAARVGAKLTAVTGPLTFPATGFNYHWFRDGKALPFDTGTIYVSNTMVGHVITVRVQAYAGGWNNISATSPPFGPIPAQTLTRTPRPTITGKLKVGTVIAVKTGTWTADPHFTYQWFANGKRISGGIHAKLHLTAKLAGKKISVRVTGAKFSYTSVAMTSKKSKKVVR